MHLHDNHDTLLGFLLSPSVSQILHSEERKRVSCDPPLHPERTCTTWRTRSPMRPAINARQPFPCLATCTTPCLEFNPWIFTFFCWGLSEHGLPGEGRRGRGVRGTTDHLGTVPVFPFLPLLFLACYVGYRLWGFDGLKFYGSDDGGVEGSLFPSLRSARPPPSAVVPEREAKAQMSRRWRRKKEDLLCECARKWL